MSISPLSEIQSNRDYLTGVSHGGNLSLALTQSNCINCKKEYRPTKDVILCTLVTDKENATKNLVWWHSRNNGLNCSKKTAI